MGIVHHIELKEGKRGLLWRQRWWSTQVASNGEILYTSELYSSAEKRDHTAYDASAQLEVPVERVA